MCTQAFFSFLFAWNNFFHSFTFSLCMSLDLKWVSCRQHKYESWFCVHSATLCLLIGAFSSFIFKVIIDKYVLIATWLIVLELFLQFFFVLFFFFCSLLLWFDNHLYIMFRFFLFFVCVYIIDFWLVVTMRFIYSNLYVYMIISSCLSLKFKNILTTLHFYSPQPAFTIFNLIFCIFLFCLSLNYLLWIQMILLLFSFNLPTSFIGGWFTSFTVYLPLAMRFFLL